MIKRAIFTLMGFVFLRVHAQDTAKTRIDSLVISGYVETYYSFDMGYPNNHLRPGFFYSFNKHNEINLNIGFIKAAYFKDNVRGNFALMAGTYTQFNLAHEQPLLRNIFEANAGFKLSNKRNVWLDAGILPSHIGFESTIGKDCWNLTRSILADNSPYYEAGIKLGYTSKNEKLYLAALYLNGWQRIQRAQGNQTPAFGTQLNYKASDKSTFNWSTYIGNDQPDSIGSLWRYFNNFYRQFQVNKKFGFTAGFDIGIQQKRDTLKVLMNDMSIWHSTILILRYAPTKKKKIALRIESYKDIDGVIIATGTSNGFQTLGYSLNLDYAVRENVLWRIEGRALASADKIFMLNNNPSKYNYFLTTSLAISF